MELDNNAHSVFLLYYHLVLVVKYRRKVFDDNISDRDKEIFEYISPNYNITLQELWKEYFWSQSFCVLTTGGAPIEVIKKYIQSQGEKQ